MENNFTGSISMNPQRLYQISINGANLGEKVKTNYQKLNVTIEELLSAVKTPELNKQLEMLYEIFKKIEENFNGYNNTLNTFFANKIEEYNKHAQNISDASEYVIGNVGIDGNAVPSTGIAIDRQFGVGSIDNEFNNRNKVNNDSNVNLDVQKDFKTDSLNLKDVQYGNSSDLEYLHVDNGATIVKSGMNGEGVIHLDSREWEGFGPKSDR